MTNWAVFVAGLMNSKLMQNRRISIRCLVMEANLQTKFTYDVTVQQGLRSRAIKVLKQAHSIMLELGDRDDGPDADWYEDGLLEELFTVDVADTLILLAKGAHRLIKQQPMITDVSTPCRVFGDLHGQLRDLLLVMKAFGFPRKDGMSFIFNGDFVDRGRHQIEVLGLLLAMKVLMPGRVWLVRGNHEDDIMNGKYGFRDEVLRCLGKPFGMKTYECFKEVFDALPLAALVDGRVLCVHGGIGDGKWHLDDLRMVKRPLRPADLRADSMLTNILWSDPIEEDGKQPVGVFGVHQSPRSGTSAEIVEFGWNVTKTFCARNGLSMVIRSHQSKLEGHGFDVMHERLLMRVFSARDYEGNSNDGATLLLTPGGGGDLSSSDMSLRERYLQGINVRVQAVASYNSGRL